MLTSVVFCLCVTALFAYCNARFFKLPATIAVMALAMLASLGLMAVEELGDVVGVSMAWQAELKAFLRATDFSQVLLNGMLSVLLFAGALDVDLRALKQYQLRVAMLAVGATAISTIIIGVGTFVVLDVMDINMPMIYCLLFGALISPTDPIAVLAILREADAPNGLELVISGESLFNDGVGVVFFTLLLTVALTGHTPSVGEGLHMLAVEGGGGIVLGLLLGGLMYYLLRTTDDATVAVLVTLATVLGGYQLAMYLELSGPLAMVVAGMVVGNQGRQRAMSPETCKNMNVFWELMDKVFNDILFVLLGLNVLLVSFDLKLLVAGAIIIVVSLIARGIAVGWPVRHYRHWFMLPRGSWQVLVWGGLRGGISVALALSLPESEEKNIILMLTYCVVVFAILVQGMTVKPLMHRVLGKMLN